MFSIAIHFCWEIFFSAHESKWMEKCLKTTTTTTATKTKTLPCAVEIRSAALGQPSIDRFRIPFRFVTISNWNRKHFILLFRIRLFMDVAMCSNQTSRHVSIRWMAERVNCVGILYERTGQTEPMQCKQFNCFPMTIFQTIDGVDSQAKTHMKCTETFTSSEWNIKTFDFDCNF